MHGTRDQGDQRDPEPTETPLWVRIEAETASFAPRRIAPELGAPWLTVLVVAIAVAGLVGLANAVPATPSSAAAAQPSVGAVATGDVAAAPAVDVRPPALGRLKGGAGVAPVTLLAPLGHDGEITGAAVPVDGQLEVHASSLRIALEGDRFASIESLLIDTTDPNGGLRPDTTPTFHVELPMPSPRPVGRLWVVITAYDRSGNQIGTVQSAVLIGPAAAG